MKIDFKGKTVLVTGATRGIGEEISKEFYKAGASLLLTGTNQDIIDRMNYNFRRNRRIKYFQLNFLNDRSVNDFLKEIKKIKKIDVCINNSGINRINYIYETLTTDWDEIIRVNLRGPFLISKEVGIIMKKNRYGRIINIASIFGVITKEKRAAYSAAKSGLIGLTKAASLDLAPANVLVNSVSPGFIMTGLTRKILLSKDLNVIKDSIPLGRLGSPKDVSAVVLFLASDLNSYITGQNVIVDGGYVNI